MADMTNKESKSIFAWKKKKDLSTIYSGEESSFHSTNNTNLITIMNASALSKTTNVFGPSSSDSSSGVSGSDTSDEDEGSSEIVDRNDGDDSLAAISTEVEFDLEHGGQIHYEKNLLLNKRNRSEASSSTDWVDDNESTSTGSFQVSSVQTFDNDNDDEVQSFDSLNTSRLEDLRRKKILATAVRNAITPIAEGDESRHSFTSRPSSKNASLSSKGSMSIGSRSRHSVNTKNTSEKVASVASAAHTSPPSAVYTEEQLRNVEYARLEVASTRELSTVAPISKTEAQKAFEREIPEIIPCVTMNDDLSSIGGGNYFKSTGSSYASGVGSASGLASTGIVAGTNVNPSSPAANCSSKSIPSFRPITTPSPTSIQYLPTEEQPPPQSRLPRVDEGNLCPEMRVVGRHTPVPNDKKIMWYQQRSELELILMVIISISIVILIVMIVVLVKQT